VFDSGKASASRLEIIPAYLLSVEYLPLGQHLGLSVGKRYLMFLIRKCGSLQLCPAHVDDARAMECGRCRQRASLERRRSKTRCQLLSGTPL
jgi:hypothetical protein